MSNDDINKHTSGSIDDQNNTPADDFDGLTPNQMEQLLYHPFEGHTVVKFAHKAVHGIFADSPLFLIAWDLLTHTSECGGVKLSSQGFLPLKLIKSIYHKGYFPDEDIDEGEIELRSEYDWMLLFIVKHLLIISELTEVEDNVFTLTKKGSELLADKADYKVYMELLKAFCLGFSWASNDSFESAEIGQAGFMYLIYLLKKYGDTPRHPAFYDEKYFRAFPMLYVEQEPEEEEEEEDDPEFVDVEESEVDEDFEDDPEYAPDSEEDRLYCLELRFFERFCRWFGLAEITMDYSLPVDELSIEMLEKIGEVKRSKLFERIIV